MWIPLRCECGATLDRDPEREIKANQAEAIVVPRTREWQIQIKWLEKDGAAVRAGQRVVEFDTSPFTAGLQERRLAAARARLDLEREQATLEAQLAERELAAQEQRIALAEAEKEVGRGAERLYALRGEIKQLEGRIELARRECAGLAESNAGREQELVQLRAQLAQAEAEAAQAVDELAQLEEAVAGQQDAVDRAETEVNAAREQLRGHERERDAGNEALVAVLTGIARAEDRIAAVADRRDVIDQRLRVARTFLQHKACR